jgi:hypothetical protein
MDRHPSNLRPKIRAFLGYYTMVVRAAASCHHHSSIGLYRGSNFSALQLPVNRQAMIEPLVRFQFPFSRGEVMSALREKMECDLKIQGYSAKTVSTYLNCVRDFVIYHGHSPGVAVFLSRHAGPRLGRQGTQDLVGLDQYMWRCIECPRFNEESLEL